MQDRIKMFGARAKARLGPLNQLKSIIFCQNMYRYQVWVENIFLEEAH